MKHLLFFDNLSFTSLLIRYLLLIYIDAKNIIAWDNAFFNWTLRLLHFEPDSQITPYGPLDKMVSQITPFRSEATIY